MKRPTQFKRIRRWGFLLIGSLVGLLTTTPSDKVEGAGLGGPTHIGTFEGGTTFTTSSSNGINPGLFLEVMDEYGNLTQYESEEGFISLPNTKEGGYVTQAKLLGKTKYRDQDTGELLEEWEEGRNLELVSVESPELKTSGKNLVPLKEDWVKGQIMNGGWVSVNEYSLMTKSKIRVKPNTTYTISTKNNDCKIAYHEWRSDGSYVKDSTWITSFPYTFTTGSTTHYINLTTRRISDIFSSVDDLDTNLIWQLEESSVPTTYEPYQSNLLTIDGQLELRKIRDVRDELDLITGEAIMGTEEVVLNGSEDWGLTDIEKYPDKVNTLAFHVDDLLVGTYQGSPVVCDKFKFPVAFPTDAEGIQRQSSSKTRIYVSINKSRLSTLDVDGFKRWLEDNPTTIQYLFEEPVTKPIILDSTYYFQPVMNREVYINGTIFPLVCSLKVPTEPLSFVINPNAEVGQQFVAPEFTVVNESPTYIHLELNRFEQTTQVLNDVRPEAHEDWSLLEREQSKDIALALVPKPSDGWKTFIEGERYVADNSNYYLGEVKAKSSVDFTFTASHGLAFIETLSPQYRLSFMFDFFGK